MIDILEYVECLRKDKQIPFPWIIQLEITDICPFACPQCYKKGQLNKQMDFTKIVQMLKECSENGTKLFVLNGGEPLLYYKIIDLIKKSAEEANSRTNALRKDRCFKIGELIDSTHIEVQLLSDTEVIPSRALTALSRSMITLDSANILDDHIYRGCVLKSETIKTSCNINITNISDVQLLTSITERVFCQTNMNNRDKKLSREYTEKIRSIMLEYINQKTLTDNQFKV